MLPTRSFGSAGWSRACSSTTASTGGSPTKLSWSSCSAVIVVMTRGPLPTATRDLRPATATGSPHSARDACIPDMTVASTQPRSSPVWVQSPANTTLSHSLSPGASRYWTLPAGLCTYRSVAAKLARQNWCSNRRSPSTSSGAASSDQSNRDPDRPSGQSTVLSSRRNATALSWARLGGPVLGVVRLVGEDPAEVADARGRGLGPSPRRAGDGSCRSRCRAAPRTSRSGTGRTASRARRAGRASILGTPGSSRWRRG